MKKINFTKMSGAGNDFIIINARNGINLKKLAIKACDRCNGIGADGLLILDKSKRADYKMRIINADGTEAEMCGNGARCLAAYIRRNKKTSKRTFSMDTLAGLVLGQTDGRIAKIRLSDPIDYKPDIALTVNGRKIHISYIDTGVPHTIVYVDNLKDINVQHIGRRIRTHSKFVPRGTNVNFAEQINENLVYARTYERGVEDETKACGTGSVAVAIVTYIKSHPKIKNKMGAKMKVRTSGNEILEVTFDIKESKVSNVWLKGQTNFIARGEYYV